jgi:hypothetical protein
MVFSRRKIQARVQEPEERQIKRTSRLDPFSHLEEERAVAEDQPWFLAPDDGPELHVETGISSNLSEDDLKTE